MAKNKDGDNFVSRHSVNCYFNNLKKPSDTLNDTHEDSKSNKKFELMHYS